MKHVHTTWYRLVDGTQADPNDCAPGEDGVLRHKNGLAVALHEDGTPQSVGRDAVEGGNADAAAAADEPPAEPAPTVAEEPPVREPIADVKEPAPDPAPPATERVPAPERQAVAAKPRKAKSRDMKAGAGKTYETR